MLADDFMEMLQLLYDVKEFNMQHPNAHLSLAYTMDRLYKTNEYQQTIERWKTLAKQGPFYELAWDIFQTEYRMAFADPSVSDEVREHLVISKRKVEPEYEGKRLCRFGYMLKETGPDWFFALYGKYQPLEDLKRETAILSFLKDKGPMSLQSAEDYHTRLRRWIDLYNEFYFYVKYGHLNTWYPATAELQSAQMIIGKTGMSPMGAYRYMLYLRDKPEEALEKLENGLTLKSHWEWE